MREIKIFFTLVALLLFCGAEAQTRQTRGEYVARYNHIARAHMEKYGIPASITMAQGILESDSGNSELSTQSNNHFGIKCKADWKGRKVYYDDDAKGECFRAYKKVEDSYADHAIFLDSSPRYDSLFAYSSSDYKSWARGLKAAGYATAPHYATMLIKIIEDEKLYLLDKDNGGALYARRHELKESKNRDDESSKAVAVEQEVDVDPDNFAVTINAHKGYDVKRINGVYFTEAKAGDTIKSIAAIFEISAGNLRRFNDLKRESVLLPGDRVYIGRKGNIWGADDTKHHQVDKNETLYSISQKYAVKLSALRRLNSIKRKDEVKQGQVIKIK